VNISPQAPMDLLYKYRSIENFRFFADIILKQRLFAALYFDLNDPMEGRYLYHGEQSMDRDVEQILSGKKNKVRIVSLSRVPENELMSDILGLNQLQFLFP